jgi:hypothetical protein
VGDGVRVCRFSVNCLGFNFDGLGLGLVGDGVDVCKCQCALLLCAASNPVRRGSTAPCASVPVLSVLFRNCDHTKWHLTPRGSAPLVQDDGSGSKALPVLTHCACACGSGRFPHLRHSEEVPTCCSQPRSCLNPRLRPRARLRVLGCTPACVLDRTHALTHSRTNARTNARTHTHTKHATGSGMLENNEHNE